MAQLKVRPRSHASLQDWVAAEKGYFEDEGLADVGFVRHQTDLSAVTEGGDQLPVQTSGAYEAAQADPSKNENPDEATNVNTFCHWAVNMAVAGNHGRMWAHAYSWTVSGIYVPADSPVEKPEDLADVPIAVGRNSGSHFSTVLALEKYLAPEQINLQFVGLPNLRLGLLLEGKVQAGNGLGAPCFLLEQNGFRKIIDNSFIQGFLISGDVPVEQTTAYFRALKRAQQDIDLDPEPYKPLMLEHSIAPEFHNYVKNLAGMGIPTRIVFEDYTKEMYDDTRHWMDAHDFFAEEDQANATTRFEDAMMAAE